MLSASGIFGAMFASPRLAASAASLVAAALTSSALASASHGPVIDSRNLRLLFASTLPSWMRCESVSNRPR